MHTLWLFDHATGMLLDYLTGRWNTHDMAHAAGLHPSMHAGDVLLGDRAFGSYTHIALLWPEEPARGVPDHQRLIVDFSPGRKSRNQRPKRQRNGVPGSRQIQRLGQHDQIVEWVKPRQRPGWICPNVFATLPATLVLRELRYTVPRRGFRTSQVTLVTTLLDARRYRAEDLADLYRQRWSVETNLRHLKQTMGLNVLRCKSVEGVKKELLACAIAYNLVRPHMIDAAQRQGVPPDRISFIDALDVLCYGDAHAGPPRLRVNPERPGRHEPRVIKRRKDQYTVRTRPREQLRQDLGITRVAA